MLCGTAAAQSDAPRVKPPLRPCVLLPGLAPEGRDGTHLAGLSPLSPRGVLASGCVKGMLGVRFFTGNVLIPGWWAALSQCQRVIYIPASTEFILLVIC